MLHNLFEMSEYFILMNNKYAFFLHGDVSTFLFTPAEAFSVFISLYCSHFNLVKHTLLLSSPVF